MRRLGAALVAALVVPAAAHAAPLRDAALVKRGIAHAAARGWVKPDDAAAYRGDLAIALRDRRTLPKLRARIVDDQLHQLAAIWDSYTSPRALALFSQLRFNTDYLETHVMPTGRVDVADDEGIVYRWFVGHGFEFHPLADFGALNSAVASKDDAATRVLVDALLARAIPRGTGLVWEYSFPYGGGRAPWTSGMAQAVAAQAIGRASVFLQDPALLLSATRAYSAIPGRLLLQLAEGPWIRLYAFSRVVVLNAQLQSILSLNDYATAAADGNATALASSMTVAAEALFPRFDTGWWSLYDLGGPPAPRNYQVYVTDLLRRLATTTQDPFWNDAAQRFHHYLYDPPTVVEGTPPPTIYPQPADGFLDVAEIPVSLDMRASVTLSVAGKLSTYRLDPGDRVIRWKPPAGLAPGTYKASLSAVGINGRRRTIQLQPLVVAWDTTPPPTTAQLQGTTLTWQATDPGTPWLKLVVALDDGAGNTQTLDLGQQPVSGTTTLTPPPGTWNATLQATNSAGLTTSVQLGQLSG